MEFKESEHPRDDGGKFTKKGETAPTDKTTGELKAELTKELPNKQPHLVEAKKMTPAEKIASVHIDFDKDNILPELNDDTLEKIGVEENKPVLLKGSTIKRNLEHHMNVSDKLMQDIITEALYNPIDVFPANPKNPNYYHLASFIEVEDLNGLKMGLVLLDVDATKKYFDIGHAYFVSSDGFKRAKNKTKKD